MARCNCENLDCRHSMPSHEPAGCEKPSIPTKRVMYIGAVCWNCFYTYDPKYRINPEGN